MAFENVNNYALMNEIDSKLCFDSVVFSYYTAEKEQALAKKLELRKTPNG